MKSIINKIFNEDCLEGMQKIEPNSIDLVLCDMPYGTTNCKWDIVIDLERMWLEMKRICKPKTAIVLTASQPFTTLLINSNHGQFKYCWVWQKTCGTGFINAHYAPIKYHEDVVVFSPASAAQGAKNNMTYNPQGLVKVNKLVISRLNQSTMRLTENNKKAKKYIQEFKNYPTSIIKFDNDKTKLHPTQKPVALMEYLIKTYSNENDTVLDFCMGSGTTAIAAMNTNRNFIGFEKDKNYYDICINRINALKSKDA